MTHRKQFIPRPITDRDFWDAARRNPALEGLIESIMAVAEAASTRPSPPSATDFLAARRSNDRAILDRWWREGRATLACLALRRLLLDPVDLDDTLLNWIWVMATQPTWAVSAHLPEKDLPETYFAMDLAACEMASDLAELVETLGPWMDSVSFALRGRIIWEIEKRMLEPYSDSSTDCWWDNGTGNWSGVCAGSILAASEAFAAIGRPFPKARQRAIDALNRYVDNAFTEHGECDEGIGYWGYGLSYAVQGWMRLTDDAYEDVNRLRLRQIADYPRRAHLFGETFYAGNDADAVTPGIDWLCDTLADAEGLDWLRTWPSRSGELVHTWAFSQLLRLVALRPSETYPQTGTDEKAILLQDQQTAILRSPGTIAILEGGSNHERHNHNDIGSFQFFVDHFAVIPDLGNIWYTADYFTDKRYTYLAASSLGHNCPIVDGYEQRTGPEAAASVVEWSVDQGILTIEASAAYPHEAGLKEWLRTLNRKGVGFQIVDRFKTERPNRIIISRLWSTHPITRAVPSTFELGPLTVTSTVPKSWSVAEVDGTVEGLRAFGGKTLYRLDLEFETDGDGALGVVLDVLRR